MDTGQTVVLTAMVTVVTWALKGQLGTSWAHLLIVLVVVA